MAGNRCLIFGSREPEIWEPVNAAAMILKRTVINRGLAARLCILYIPKGPLLDWSNRELARQVLSDVEGLAKEQGAIFLKFDPDIVVGTGIPGSEEAKEDKDRAVHYFYTEGKRLALFIRSNPIP